MKSESDTPFPKKKTGGAHTVRAYPAEWESQHAINNEEIWSNEFLLVLLMTPMEFFTAYNTCNTFDGRPAGRPRRKSENRIARAAHGPWVMPHAVISMVDHILLINITFQQSIYCPDLVRFFYCFGCWRRRRCPAIQWRWAMARNPQINAMKCRMGENEISE